jgi:membrane-anchored mycosin MYCP
LRQSWITRAARRVVPAAALTTVVLGLAAPAPAHAAGDNVPYYAVQASYGGKPENLTEISRRFLGDGDRYAEILNLNSGRLQHDGRELTDPARLTAGWLLELPWDAHGTGLRYGELPAKAPETGSGGQTTKPVRPTSPAQGSPGATPRQSASVSADPPGAKSPGAKSPGAAPPGAGPLAPAAVVPQPGSRPVSDARNCSVDMPAAGRADWASLRLAAGKAWPQGRGKGQVIALLDSGVDGALPQLSNRIARGIDVASGSGRGDTDCLGTGTAMAGLMVAEAVKGSAVTGLAPEATVLPVRVADRRPGVTAATGAKAIREAVESGATVVALGSYMDLNSAEVAAAVREAVGRGVVVVAGAALASVPAGPSTELGEGVIRVGGAATDGQMAAAHTKGAVDVVAPGVAVNTTGITGSGTVAVTGTQYAVALVAAQVALVRSALPNLGPEQIRHRVLKTAESLGGGDRPDGVHGWGMIDPAASVTEVLPEEDRVAAPAASTTEAGDPDRRGRTVMLVIAVLVALAAAVSLALRIRRLLREDRNGGNEDTVYHAPGPA